MMGVAAGQQKKEVVGLENTLLTRHFNTCTRQTHEEDIIDRRMHHPFDSLSA